MAMANGNFSHDKNEAPKADRVMDLFSLKGKSAIVSGAGSGIGLAVARGLAEMGANVAIWYNTNQDAIERSKEIKEDFGVQCKSYQVDVTDYDAVKVAIDQAVKDLGGRLDIFVANSGITWSEGAAIDGSIAEYRKVMKTDIDSVFFSGILAAAHFRRQRSEQTDLDGNPITFREGSFIATSSMSGQVINIPQQQAPYNAAKAAVTHLCKSFAVEWAGFARSNCVCPGYTNTDLTKNTSPEKKGLWKNKIPLGREGSTIEMVGTYLLLASDASTYTTGAAILVDGGYSLP